MDNNDVLKIGDPVEVMFSNGYVKVGRIIEITNDTNFNYVVQIDCINQEDSFTFNHTLHEVYCNSKDLKKITN